MKRSLSKEKFLPFIGTHFHTYDREARYETWENGADSSESSVLRLTAQKRRHFLEEMEAQHKTHKTTNAFFPEPDGYLFHYYPDEEAVLGGAQGVYDNKFWSGRFQKGD